MSAESSKLDSMVRRARSANLTTEERLLLVNLVISHFNVLENKQTDAVTTATKNHTWGVLTSEFNAQSGQPDRTRENLKAAWENMKRLARRTAAGRERSTDGGPSKRTKYDPLLRKILTLIQPSAVLKFDEFVDCDVSLEEPGLRTASYDGDEMDDPAFNVAIEHAYDRDWYSHASVPESDTLSNIRVEKVETLDEPSESTQDISDEGSTSVEKAKLQLLNKQYQIAVQEREENREINRVKLEIEREKLKQEKIRTRLLLLEMKSHKSGQ